MALRYSLLAFCFAAPSNAIKFQNRGSANHTAAPYSNSTPTAGPSISIDANASQLSLTSSPSVHLPATETPYSTNDLNLGPTKTGPTLVDSYNATDRNSTQRTNASCTVHVPDAEIKWWFPVTISLPIATITRAWGTYSNSRNYTFVPHTTSFDIASALEIEALCTSGWTTYTEWQWTAYECIPYTDRPTAASTALAYRSAVPPIPTESEIPQYDVWMYDIMLDDLPSPTTKIPVAPNSTIVETMPTPFVQFTAYEVERGNSTETVQLSSTYLQSYWQKGIEHEQAATGSLPDGFMEQIPQASCVAGNLQAVVTVIIFVDLYYLHLAHFAPGIVHWESSALPWDWNDDMPLGIVDLTFDNPLPQIKTDWVFSATATGSAKPEATRAVKPATVGGPNSKTSAVQTIGTIGTAPVVVGPSSVVVVGSQTLRPDGSALTVGGTPVALVPSATAIIVGGTSLPLPHNSRPGQQQTVGTLGNIPVVVGPSSAVVIGTQTLQPGGPAITIGPGTTVALAPSAAALVIGATTWNLPQVVNQNTNKVAPPVLTIGSRTFVPNAATQFFIGPGQTLTPGGTVFVDGVQVSLDTSAAFVVVGGSTQSVPSSGSLSGSYNLRPELVVGGSTFTAMPSSSVPDDSLSDSKNGQDSSGPTFVIAGQTLVPGGAPVTLSGSTLSLAPLGSFLVIDGSTTTLATPAADTAAQITPPPLTIGNGVFRPLPGTGTTYQIGTALLTPGGSVVVAGTTISLALGATALVVNGITTTLNLQAQPRITNPPILTIGSQTYTAVSGAETAFIVGGQTLTPGGTITVDGTTIILSPQATELLYGSSGRSTTSTLFPATMTSAVGSIKSSGASERQSGGQTVPTSTRGGAPQVRQSITGLLGAVGCIVWPLI